MDQQTEMILAVQGLTKVYAGDIFRKKKRVFENLTLHFPKGRCVGLMGHNGAGKTTTIRTIFGLIKPDKGSVLFDGHPLEKNDRMRIGYMPETNKLPGTLTCEEFLRTTLRLYRPRLSSSEVEKRLSDKLGAVGLGPHRGQRIDRLSKGMGRRLAWAQATIHQPDLLILDEPFSGMDPYGRYEVLRWIREMKNERVSIVICGHELEMLQQVCDDYHVLKQGELVFSTIEAGFPRLVDGFYRLLISGCDESGLSALRHKGNLPAWTQLTRERYLVRLQFRHYPDAAAWLQATLKEGLVVVGFDEMRGLSEEALLPFFALGGKA